MKKINGFFFVETAITLLLIFSVLLIAVLDYNLCLKKMTRENELSRAMFYCESELSGRHPLDIRTGFQLQTSNQTYVGFEIEEIRVVKNGQIIFNLAQIK